MDIILEPCDWNNLNLILLNLNGVKDVSLRLVLEHIGFQANRHVGVVLEYGYGLKANRCLLHASLRMDQHVLGCDGAVHLFKLEAKFTDLVQWHILYHVEVTFNLEVQIDLSLCHLILLECQEKCAHFLCKLWIIECDLLIREYLKKVEIQI